MPSFEPSFGRGSARRVGSLPPQPTYIRQLVQGEVHEAFLALEAPKHPRTRPSAAQKAGLAYQRKIERWAADRVWGGAIVYSPWFCYSAGPSNQRKYCQPDLLFDSGRGGVMVVCEVKLRWHPDAWWQLRRLYEPVLRVVYPDRTLVPICVCRSFDPAIPAPEPVELVSDLASCKPGRVSVLIVE